MGEAEAFTSGDYGKKYELVRELGKGAFGCVQLSRHRNSGDEVGLLLFRALYRDNF